LTASALLQRTLTPGFIQAKRPHRNGDDRLHAPAIREIPKMSIDQRRGPSRRAALGGLGLAGLTMAGGRRVWAEGETTLPLPGGPQSRPLTTAFPQKGEMILQRTRPPLLETPFAVFDKGVFTPNDQFFVRWHWAVIPTEVDVERFRLGVTGHVNTPQSITLAELLAMPRVELAAVNQCSGNSRGYFAPRVAGGQWANGAMGNAKWMGVRLKDVLARAGVRAGAQRVRFAGLDDPMVSDGPKFVKSLDLDHAGDGQVMLAYAMNGKQLPLVNGFPLRLVVPGWYSTYWVKMVNSIEVLDGPDENFWTKVAYTIPDTPGADMTPGETGVKMIPINRMVPRSFITNLADGASVKAAQATVVRGIAMGGATGVKGVDTSMDGGKTWSPAELGPDEGQYSFRSWQTKLDIVAGETALMVRCTNMDGLLQPAMPNWNPSGFMRNSIETTRLHAA
jgi:DMSO/TMAO reductase YedYZ molybdopterin-dependent catalytic subunit